MTPAKAMTALAVTALVGLSATSGHAEAPDTCNRAAMADMIGEPTFYVVNVIYDIAEYAPEQVVRLLRPDQEPGYERPNRMTVLLDESSNVVEVYCG